MKPVSDIIMTFKRFPVADCVYNTDLKKKKKRSHHFSVPVSIEFLTDSLSKQILHRNISACARV